MRQRRHCCCVRILFRPLIFRLVTLCIAVITPLVSGPPVLGDVIFSRSGNDLLVNIDSPILFTVTANASDTYFGLVFEDVYSTPVTNSAFLPPAVVTSTMTLNGTSNSVYRHWGHFAFTAGALDATDFWGNYEFSSSQTLSIGDTVQVSPGVITVSGIFNQLGATLPDLTATTVQLFDGGSAFALSDPVNLSAVPEPSSMILLTTAGASLLYRRRRRTAAAATEPAAHRP